MKRVFAATDWGAHLAAWCRLIAGDTCPCGLSAPPPPSPRPLHSMATQEVHSLSSVRLWNSLDHLERERGAPSKFYGGSNGGRVRWGKFARDVCVCVCVCVGGVMM